jgi:ribosome-associated heat shock protein Hsp15
MAAMQNIDSDGATALRIDRWLYYCRFYKTRTKATSAVAGGHARLNGERAAPGNRVMVGDRIDLVRDRLDYSFEVTAIPARRGPAAEAQSCYREDEASMLKRQSRIESLRQDRLAMPRTEGRPDKRTRRQLRERRGR